MQHQGLWGTILRFWKTNKTARSPVVHFNNVVGNLILSELYDFQAPDIVDGAVEYLEKGEIYQKAFELGVFGSGFINIEIGNQNLSKMKDDLLTEIRGQERHWAVNGFFRSFNVLKAVDRVFQGAYQAEDEIFRLVSFMKDLDAGLTEEQAVQNAKDRFLNYDIRAPIPNMLRKSIFPFLSYTYLAVPQILKAIADRPWKMAKIFTIGYVLQALAFEWDDDEEGVDVWRTLAPSMLPGGAHPMHEREARVMSKNDRGYTWAGLPIMFRTPFRDSNDVPLYINLSRVIPGGGTIDSVQAPGRLPLFEWMGVSGPINIAAGIWLNRDSFTQKDVVDPLADSRTEVYKDYIGYTYRGFTPNLPFLPGTYSWNMLSRAFSEATDASGRNYDKATAIVRQFGPRVYPYDPREEHRRRLIELNLKKNAIDAQFRSEARKAGRKIISREEFQAAQEKRRRSLSRINDAVRELQG